MAPSHPASADRHVHDELGELVCVTGAFGRFRHVLPGPVRNGVRFATALRSQLRAESHKNAGTEYELGRPRKPSSGTGARLGDQPQS